MTDSVDTPAGRVAGNVRALRKRRGWSQADLAERLITAGWPSGAQGLRQALSKVESRGRQVTVDELATLGAAFGVEPWSLATAPVCGQCMGCPPGGFRCLACGADGVL